MKTLIVPFLYWSPLALSDHTLPQTTPNPSPPAPTDEPVILLHTLENTTSELFDLSRYSDADSFKLYKNTENIAVYHAQTLGPPVQAYVKDLYKKRVSLNENTLKLQLSNVKIPDEGEYEIRFQFFGVATENEFKKHKIQLQVVRAPKLSIVPNQKLRVNYKNYSTNIATCIANGARPAARIQWEILDSFQPEEWREIDMSPTQDPSGFEFFTKNLLKFVLEPEHNGKVVRCRVVGHPSENFKSQLNVAEFKDHVDFKMNVEYIPTVHGIEVGEMKSLRCRATGNPEPDIFWYRPSLTNDFQWEKLENIEGSNELSIHDYSNVNFTNVKCTAKNVQGEDEFQMFLKDIVTRSRPMGQSTSSGGMKIGFIALAIFISVLLTYAMIKICRRSSSRPAKTFESQRMLSENPVVNPSTHSLPRSGYKASNEEPVFEDEKCLPPFFPSHENNLNLSSVSNNIPSAQYSANLEQTNIHTTHSKSYSHDDITEQEASIYIDDPSQRYNSQDEPIDNEDKD